MPTETASPSDREQAHGPVDPADPADTHGAWGDPDGDHLANLEEFQAGSDPRRADADGRAGLVRSEWWFGLSGEYPFDLTGSPRFAGEPDAIRYLDRLELPPESGEAYGVRLRGFLCPRRTGAHRFYLAGAGRAELWLAQDGRPETRRLAALLSDATEPGEWERFPEQSSAPQLLRQGARYAFEILFKAGQGPDSLQAGWQGPGDPAPAVLTGECLAAWSPDPDDRDDNGLPDAYEDRSGLTRAGLPPSRGHAFADADADGRTQFAEFLAGTDPLTPDPADPGNPRGAAAEWWDLVPGNRIEDLAADPRFPGAPDHRATLPRLDLPPDRGDLYGTRLRAWVLPPVTGPYRFVLSADNHARLWLAEDERPFSARVIAEVAGWAAHRSQPAWSQRSEPLPLEAGRRYYLEVLHKEGGREDYATVEWEIPGGPRTAVAVPFLIPYTGDPEDADGDRLPDSWERARGLDPAVAAAPDGAWGDADGDGLDNGTEFLAGSDPRQADAEGRPGLVRWEAWDRIGGRQVAELLRSPAFPGRPSARGYLPGLEFYQNFEDDYGSRLRAFLVPPRTGPYTFWVAGDDETELWLADGPDKWSRQRIARVPDWTGFREWSRFAEQRSAPVTLEAGRPYYVEVRHKDGLYGDHASVAWSAPGAGGEPEVIRGGHVAAYQRDPRDLDDDDLPDDWERAQGIDPRNASHDHSAWGDPDADGLLNLEEHGLGTDPLLADTDGDGVSDRDETSFYGTDPLVLDLGAPEVFADLPPAAFARARGDWLRLADGSVVGATRSGSLDYRFETPERGVWILEIAGRADGPESAGIRDLPLTLQVDAQAPEAAALRSIDGAPSLARALSGLLDPGPHALRISWNISLAGLRPRIDAVRILRLTGPDADANGLSDALDRRLSQENAVTVCPGESLVSPVCLEGRSRRPGEVRLTGPQGAVPAFTGIDGGWFADVPLLPGSNTLEIHLENGLLSHRHSVSWIPVDVFAGGELLLRTGDSLLLSAGSPDQAVLPVILRLNETEELVELPPGGTVPHRFDRPGEHRITAVAESPGGLRTGELTVHVRAADFGPPLPVYAGRPRDWLAPRLPADLPLQADSKLLFLEQEEDPGGVRRFRVGLEQAGDFHVLARLWKTGPIVARGTVSGFTVASTESTGDTRVVRRFPNGDQLIRTGIAIDRFPPGATLVAEIFVAGVTFDDGTLERVLTPADFDENGLAYLTFHRPAGVATSVCHRLRVLDDAGRLLGVR